MSGASEPPAFEMRTPDGAWIRIFPSGRVEGVPVETIIVNRIPMLLAASFNEGAQWAETDEIPAKGVL